ncbi:precorrin-2 dehydrogenase/sirohydrochlorin ferrochelatase family protein [Cohnella panacarvi]|uniref:precorrin-2 dehydrogenase/sirohydrochlorin ferrochelatase family protein n=1 Tax=Cohnella panacarvi TaxID=400776 RepID=UPI0004786EF1|nr:bifunctional precorrin-2 dehydrogenase/sirohydrochlorin ferrochelatase [Cohnella panacarvi]
MSEWYPILLNLKDRTCVVIGGGAVAARKARGLLDAGANVTIVSPKLNPELSELAEAGRIRHVPKAYADGDLEGAMLVFAATDSPEANAAVLSEANRRGIPANAADGGEAGDFIVPAVLRRGDLVLTASASGSGPAVASRIIGELRDRYGPEYADYLIGLRKIRSWIKAEVADPIERRRLLEEASTDQSLTEWSKLDDRADIHAIIERLKVRALGRKG